MNEPRQVAGVLGPMGALRGSLVSLADHGEDRCICSDRRRLQCSVRSSARWLPRQNLLPSSQSQPIIAR